MKITGRLYVINSPHTTIEMLPDVVERAFAGGVDIFQLRLKNLPRDEILKTGEKVKKLAEKYGVSFIVNDDPGIAKELDADGVHVGKGDFRVKAARELLGDGKIVGASSYDDLDLALKLQNEGADYLGFSSPFDSPTKPTKPKTSPDIIKRACKILKIPVFAIGGINLENVEDVLKLGVHGVAVISGVFGSGDPYENVKRLREKIYKFFGENP